MFRRYALVASVILSSLRASSALGDPPAPEADRSLITVPPVPAHARPSWWPAGVPADYVITPNGYFHPSCVIPVHEDEIFDHDLHIRGKDGSVHQTLTPCAYPRYSPTGRLVQGPSPDSSAPAVEPAPFYDGWLVSYWYDTEPVLPDSTVSGKWVVPSSPIGDVTTGDDRVTIFFFNDVTMEEESQSDSSILQPVLGYDQVDNPIWSLQDWNCCVSGLEATSDAIAVNPGDVLEGVTAGSNCDQTGVCSTWTITGTDLTTGAQPTVLVTTDPNVPNVVNPAVLEAYGVTACDMFTPGGEETFYDHQVTTTAGAETLLYTLYVSPESGSPSCGYSGATSGDAYTLIFSSSPTTPATATTLAASATAVAPGTAVTLTATVTSDTTSTPFAGNVTFLDGTTALSTVDLGGYSTTGGEASLTGTWKVASLAAGTHSLTAHFNGDNGFQPSTSAPVSVTVSKQPTRISVQAMPDTVGQGKPSTLSATVTSSAPAGLPAMTGTITFTTDGSPIISMPVSSTSSTTGTAQFETSVLPVGTASIEATYSGDSIYAGATSAAVDVDVTGSGGCRCDAHGPANADLLEALGLLLAWPLAARRRRPATWVA